MEEGNSSGGATIASLETGKADRSVWLMKCPAGVAKSWQTRASSGDSLPVAKVVLSLDPLQPDDSSLQFSMEMMDNEIENAPRRYSLNMYKDIIPMCVFSEASQGKVSVEGKVEHKFDMKPRDDNMEQYSRLCRERTNQSMVKSRQIQVISNDHGVHMTPMPGTFGFMQSKDKKRAAPVKPSDMKRTRRDRGELESIMFKLFERQPNWALKQLVQETDQPAQFLKEVLNELCVYNKRGVNQGSYELKPEYKRFVKENSPE